MTEAIMGRMPDWYRQALIECMRYRCQDEGGCLVWQAFGNSSGYPQQRVTTHAESLTVSAHRLMYWLAAGEPDHQVSHLCHNKRCLHLHHLVDETGEDNSQRKECAKNEEKFCLGHGDKPACLVM